MAQLSQTQLDAITKSLLAGNDLGTAYKAANLDATHASKEQETQINTALDFSNTGNFVTLSKGTSQTLPSTNTTTTAPAPTTTESGTSGGTSTTIHPTTTGVTLADGSTFQLDSRVTLDDKQKQSILDALKGDSTLTSDKLASQLFGARTTKQGEAAIANFLSTQDTSGSGGTGTGGTGGTGGASQIPTTPMPTITPNPGNMWAWKATPGGGMGWQQVLDPNAPNQPIVPNPTPAPAPAAPGPDPSINVFSPGGVGDTNTTEGGTTQFGVPFAGTGAQEAPSFSSEDQLAIQQSELNRQQLEGALNQRGISESGRGDLLRDISGLQAELQVGGSDFRPVGGQTPNFAPRELPGQPGGPTASPDGQPTSRPEDAFRPFDAPEISSLNEPGQFGDIQEALRASDAAQSAQLGQGNPINELGDAAMAKAMRQMSTVVPGGFGNQSLDPFLAMERTRNGVGNNGRNLATPQEVFDAELKDRQQSRQKNQLDLARGFLTSFRRAQSIESQQGDLMDQFQELNRATGFDVSLGQSTMNPENRARLEALRGEIQKLEQSKLSLVERVQGEYKRWQGNEERRVAQEIERVKRRRGVQKAGAIAAKKLTAHHESAARKLLAARGIDPDAMGANGLTNQQTMVATKGAGAIEVELHKRGIRLEG